MNRRACGSPAFSVLELLVAVGIAAVLAGLLIAVTRSALDLWQRSQDRAAADVQLKVAIDFLVRDIQAAIRRESGETTLALDLVSAADLGGHGWRQDYAGANKPDVIALPALAEESPDVGVETARFGRGGAWLRLLTTHVRAGGSLPTVVSYQINRRPVSGAVMATHPPAVRYTLFRQFLDPAKPLADGYAVDRFDADLDQPGLDDALCDNVVDFGLWFHRRAADGTLLPLYPNGPTDRRFRGDGSRFPDVIDVMLRVLTDRGAERLERMEAGLVRRPADYATDEAWWWAVVESESRVVLVRIRVEVEAGHD